MRCGTAAFRRENIYDPLQESIDISSYHGEWPGADTLSRPLLLCICWSISMSTVLIEESELQQFSIAALQKVGISQQDAETVASALIEADLRGVASHGISALSGYINHLERGGVKRDAIPRILVQGPAFASIDGRAGFGPVVAKFATELAIEKARQTGIGFVTAIILEQRQFML